MPDGRLYLYGSLDEREDRYCSGRYRVASTADLREWTMHPTSFTTDDVPWAGVVPPSGRSFLDGQRGPAPIACGPCCATSPRGSPMAKGSSW